MQKNRFRPLYAAAFKVDAVAVEKQHGVRRVGLGAETVAGEYPEAAIGHFLDTLVALQRLTF